MRHSRGNSTEGRWTEEGRMLAELIDARFDSHAEFARMMGRTPFVVSNWCRGITRLKGDERKKAAALLQVPETQLIVPTSDDVRLLVSRPVGTKNIGGRVPVARVGFRNVPIYGALTAGAMAYTLSDVLDYEELPDWGGDFERWGRIVSGPSMEPEFVDGDIVIFENRRHEDGHAVHAFANGEDTFKVYKRTAEGERLFPTNSEFDPLEAKEYNVKGVVVARIRNERTHKDVRWYRGGYRHHF
jgi:SOS-response transcriptional repressor LexA